MSDPSRNLHSYRNDAAIMQRALKLQELDLRSSEEASSRQALVEAAAEVGVPAHYVERAATELKAEREAARLRRRRFLVMAAGVSAMAVAVGLGVSMTLPPAPAPYPLASQPPRWTLSKNDGTQASLRFETTPVGEAAVISVERFTPDPNNNRYHVNVDASEGLPLVEKYRYAVFRARGQGLGQVRLFLERGENERWRGPAVPLGAAWSEHRLPLDSFEHQHRPDGNNWRGARPSSPHDIKRLSFKLGSFMNDASAKGEVALDSLRFE